MSGRRKWVLAIAGVAAAILIGAGFFAILWPVFRQTVWSSQLERHLDRGETALQAANYAAAEAEFHSALVLAEKLPDSEERQLAALYDLNDACYARQQFSACAVILQRMIAIQERLPSYDKGRRACTMSELADIYRMMGKYRESEDLLVAAMKMLEAMGTDSDYTVTVLFRYYDLLGTTGRVQESQKVKKRIEDIQASHGLPPFFQ